MPLLDQSVCQYYYIIDYLIFMSVFRYFINLLNMPGNGHICSKMDDVNLKLIP